MMRTPASDLRRLHRINAAVWSLIFILTVMASYHVSASMPTELAVFIWVLSAVTVAGGFYLLFLYKEAPDDFFCIIPLISLAFVSYNSIAAICLSIEDPWTVAFVSACYIDVILLYLCFHLMMRTPASDLRRLQRINAAVWSLIFILTVRVSYHVSASMPPAMAVFIWVSSAVTVVGGFYLLFPTKEAPEEEEAEDLTLAIA